MISRIQNVSDFGVDELDFVIRASQLSVVSNKSTNVVT